MNAPTIWIVVPIFFGLLLLFTNSQRALSILGGVFAATLALIAQFVPLEEALRLGTFSFKIDSSLNILGRVLVILPAEGPLLALIYGATALWFFGAEATKTATRLVPIGLMITGLMVASLAVEPFLYAALFIEMAVLLAIPLLISIYSPPGRGIVRFLIYQTLAMPFILVTGCFWQAWKLARVTWRSPLNQRPCWGWGSLFCWLSSHSTIGSPCYLKKPLPISRATCYGSSRPSPPFSGRAFLIAIHGCAPPHN